MVSESAGWLIVAAARWCVRPSSPDREQPDSLKHGSTLSGVPTLNASGGQILVGRSNLQLLGIYDGSNKVLKAVWKHVYLRWLRHRASCAPPDPTREEAAEDGCLQFIMQGIFLPFQVDQGAVEEFNLTSDGEFRAVKSLVLGRVHGKRSRQRVSVLRLDGGSLMETPHGVLLPRFRCNTRRLLSSNRRTADKRCENVRLQRASWLFSAHKPLSLKQNSALRLFRAQILIL